MGASLTQCEATDTLHFKRQCVWSHSSACVQVQMSKMSLIVFEPCAIGIRTMSMPKHGRQ